MSDDVPSHVQCPTEPSYPVIAFAASVGGLNALTRILSALPADFPAALIVVQHRTAREPNFLVKILADCTSLAVKSAGEGDCLRTGTVFVAVPDWHLLVTPEWRLSLVQTEKVKHLRPSADPLLLSMAATLKGRAVAVVLTGHDGDGSGGVGAVHAEGGYIIAQEPGTAEVPSMPEAAIATGVVDRVVPLGEIAAALMAVVAGRASRRRFPRP
jgi:two-component system, chemotaxis family, protein-glutamate methylesterase/glutaminase